MRLKKNKIFYIPLILFTLLLLYSYNDLMTSQQAGFKEASRGLVYIYLSALIGLLTLYVSIRSRGYILRTRIFFSLTILLVWIVFVNIINRVDLWYATILLMMVLWWIVAYFFFFIYL